MSGAERPSAVSTRISRSRAVSSTRCTPSRAIAGEGTASGGRMALRRVRISRWIRTRFSGSGRASRRARWLPRTASRRSAGIRIAAVARRPSGGWPRSTPPTTCCARPRRTGPHRDSAATAAGAAGSPDYVRRALGPELLDALTEAEAVRLVTPPARGRARGRYSRSPTAGSCGCSTTPCQPRPVGPFREVAAVCCGDAGARRRSAWGRPADAATASPTCGRTPRRRSSDTCARPPRAGS